MKSQTAHLSHTLKTAIKTMGLSLREVEKRLGMSRGYLTRLFGGEIDLKVDHVADIAEALGVEPEEIFRLAFPASRAEPTHQIMRLREGFGIEPPPPVETKPQPSSSPLSAAIQQEIEALVQQALGKAFGKLSGAA
jgi:transcriptional regulator with XRE-family HTH domain